MPQDEQAALIGADGDAEGFSVLLFRLGTSWLALPTRVCKEVAERRVIHVLPHRTGGALLGMVNIRGELHLCFALSQWLGLEPRHDADELAPHLSSQRLLVAERAAERWVFLVDAIHGIQHYPRSALEELPPTATPATRLVTVGSIDWHGTLVIYLDPERLFPALHREIV